MLFLMCLFACWASVALGCELLRWLCVFREKEREHLLNISDDWKRVVR